MAWVLIKGVSIKYLALLLLLIGTLSAQQIDAPKPKESHQTLKFVLAAGALAGTSGYYEYAIHDGARQCQAEDNAAGIGKLFGTAPSFGLHPHTYRILIPGAAALGTATIFKLTGHPTIALRILTYGAALQGGVAGAVQWAGCN